MADEQLIQGGINKGKKVEAPAKQATPKPVKVDEKVEMKTEGKKEDDKKKVAPAPKGVPSTKGKIKKSEAVVNGKSLSLSLKYSVAIGKFIKRKKIDEAISDLEQVIIKKKVVPMTGEIAHQKGKGIMSGKYPVNASGVFIKLLKTLKGNSIVNGMELENTRIVEVILNKAPKQMHKGGRTQFKRTHVSIRAKEIGGRG